MWESHGIDISTTDEFPEPLKRASSKPSQEGAFRCEVCSKTFSRSFNLKTHQKVHSNEKPWPCPSCTKTFAREHDLKRHQALHTGAKTWICRGIFKGWVWGCDTPFGRSEHLQKHIQSKKGMQCLRQLRLETEEKGGAADRDGTNITNMKSDETGDEWWDDFIKDAERGGESWWHEMVKMMVPVDDIG